MLGFNPASRFDATQVLQHDFLSLYHDVNDEPEAVDRFDWGFNSGNFSVDTWEVHSFFICCSIISRRRFTMKSWIFTVHRSKQHECL